MSIAYLGLGLATLIAPVTPYGLALVSLAACAHAYRRQRDWFAPELVCLGGMLYALVGAALATLLNPNVASLPLRGHAAGWPLVVAGIVMGRRLPPPPLRALNHAHFTALVSLAITAALAVVTALALEASLPLLNDVSRHELGGVSTTATLCAALMAAVLTGVAQHRGERLLALALLGAGILFNAALGFRSPIVICVLTAIVASHYAVRKWRLHHLAWVSLLVVVSMSAYAAHRYEPSRLSMGLASDLRRAKLDSLPAASILGPLLIVPQEGMLVFGLVARALDAHGHWWGALHASSIETLRPGKQLGPREHLGMLARQYEHSNTGTFFAAPWVDFGMAGVCGFALLLGLLLGERHGAARQGGPIPAATYGVLLSFALVWIHSGAVDVSNLLVLGTIAVTLWLASANGPTIRLSWARGSRA